MKKENLNQIVEQFSKTDTIEEIEKYLVEKYPYFDRSDINDIIIDILHKQNEISQENRQYRLSELEVKINQLQKILDGANFAEVIDAYKKYIAINGPTLFIGLLGSVCTASTYAAYSNYDYGNKKDIATAFIFLTMVGVVAVSNYIPDFLEVEEMAEARNAYKKAYKQYKNAKKSLIESGITKKELREQINILTKEYKTLKFEEKNYEINQQSIDIKNVYDKINESNEDEDVKNDIENAKQRVLLSR